MNLLGGVKVDAIIADPPYGTTACKWDNIIPFDKMWGKLNQLIKDNGAIVLFGSEPFSSYCRISNINNYKYDWVWEKQKAANFMNAKYQPLKYHENIMVFGNNKTNYYPQKYQVLEFSEIKEMANKELLACIETRDIDRFGKIDRRKTVNNCINPKENHYGKMNINIRTADDGTRYPKSIIKINKAINTNLHPTQKPVQLMEYLIKTYTKENETILDFCMGSGTTGVACVNTNRKFIGIELEEKYFTIATKRIKDTEENK